MEVPRSHALIKVGGSACGIASFHKAHILVVGLGRPEEDHFSLFKGPQKCLLKREVYYENCMSKRAGTQ